MYSILFTAFFKITKKENGLILVKKKKKKIDYKLLEIKMKNKIEFEPLTWSGQHRSSVDRSWLGSCGRKKA